MKHVNTDGWIGRCRILCSVTIHPHLLPSASFAALVVRVLQTADRDSAFLLASLASLALDFCLFVTIPLHDYTCCSACYILRSLEQLCEVNRHSNHSTQYMLAEHPQNILKHIHHGSPACAHADRTHQVFVGPFHDYWQSQ